MSVLLSKQKNKRKILKIAQTRHIKLNFDSEPNGSESKLLNQNQTVEPNGNGIILYIT